MANLSAEEIYKVALDAGFTPDQAVTMTAIALAESGGRTGALNDGVGEHSVGLWQINLDAHTQWSAAEASDPLNNARMAYEVSYGGKEINPWTVTHQAKNAKYLEHREAAQAAAEANGHPEARGQWNPPLDYDDDGVGAAPDGSTSQALSTGGEITPVADDLETAAVSESATQGGSPREANAFDRVGDGVFDAVEDWLGEDLLPDQSRLPDLPDAPGFHAVSDPVDASTLQNGQVAQEDLVAAAGGNDFLLEGAPSNSWNAMVAAAKADGVDITYNDSYRDLDHQHDVAERLGLFSQGGMAAKPGTSNHGLGLAVDLDWRGSENSDTRAWMLENAAKFGWEQHSAAREAHHFTYRSELDPDPDRWLGGTPDTGGGSSDEIEVGNAFDRDGDGVYDSVESWMEGRGTPLPDHGGEAGHGDHDHAEPTLDHDADVAEPAVVGPAADASEALPPIEHDHTSDLAQILDQYDLDGDGDLVIDQLTNTDRTELRQTLADFASEHSGGDRAEFIGHFDEFVADHDGVLDFDDVIGLFDLDG